jgi:hypothetical protein
MNIRQGSVTNIIDALSIHLNYRVQLLLKEKQLRSQQTYYSITYQQETIENIDKDIKELEHKLVVLKNRIDNIDGTICPICYSDIAHRLITSCCQKSYCLECISIWFKDNHQCPTCRSKLQMSDLIAVNENKVMDIHSEDVTKLTKKDHIQRIIKNKIDGKFLIFSDYDETFFNLLDIFHEMKLNYKILKGTSSHINKILNNFKSNLINVIMLNSCFFGSGLNLECATDIIIYHKVSNDTKTQIIGRAQRVGRTSTLKVWDIRYENEHDDK